MQRIIVLLKGINVGGRNRLPMKDLVKILDGIGYSDIKTYIQSGNVVITSAWEFRLLHGTGTL